MARYAANQHDERVRPSSSGGVWGGRLARARAGQLLGLLFLIGPVLDLVDASGAPTRIGAIWLLLIAFVALYVALIPPIRSLSKGGPRVVMIGLGLLAAIAGLTLALGAPSSFVVLFVYVAAAAGFLAPPAWTPFAIGAIAVGVGMGLILTGSDGSTVAAYVLTIVAVGATLAAMRSLLRANRELAAAREEVARLAVAEERLRIARDLHDLLGHTLSVIVLKSELAGKLVETDPDRARSEIADVQRVTRDALAEVREAVHGYRRLAFADALDGARVALRAAGIDCQVRSFATEPLPPDVEDTLAWAVREGATNVVRHSGAGRCTITLVNDDRGISLQIDDDGSAPAPTDDGSGLAGLAERAHRLHGTLEAGARPGGGFRLRLALPALSS